MTKKEEDRRARVREAILAIGSLDEEEAERTRESGHALRSLWRSSPLELPSFGDDRGPAP